MASERTRRLNTLFELVLKGKKTAALQKPQLFLEAICEQTSPANSIPRVVASSQGLNTLQLALGSDTSLPFLNGKLTTFLEYIQAPDLQTVCGGRVVRQILTKLVTTPLTWSSLVNAAKNQDLNEQSLRTFAWLLVQLLSLPSEEAIAYLTVAQDPSIEKALMSSSEDIQVLGRRIIGIAHNLTGKLPDKQTNHTQRGPGGRHDNDFPEIRKISIYPTLDELKLKTSDVYLPRASDVEERAQNIDGLACHIDGQFRLLRENMLCDLREELAAAAHPKKWRRKPLEIRNLVLKNVYCDEHSPWALQFVCGGDLPEFQGLSPDERKKLLKDNKKFLKHGYLVCLSVNDKFVTLGNLVREESLLIQSPSILCVQISNTNVEKVLIQLKNAGRNIKILHVDTAVFSYEPVLKRLKETRELLLAPEIVAWQAGTEILPPEYLLNGALNELIANLCSNHSTDLQSCLQLSQSTKLDKAQAECFVAALQQRVALIQGPPGTGKSFIGSLVSKALHQCSSEKILVVCYTHHALDDFVEHLLNLGIPPHDIVRLGSVQKATVRTKALAINEYKQGIKLTPAQWDICEERKQEVVQNAKALQKAFLQFAYFKTRTRDILEFLEFYDGDLPFYSAFQILDDEDDMILVGKKGEKIDKYYLLNRWVRGEDAGIFKSYMERDYRAVWDLPYKKRKEMSEEWFQEITKERLAQFCEAGKLYNHTVEEIGDVFLERDLVVLRSKRIIACTTTAAAKYSDAIRCASPGVLLVEEAGEILESHILTALGPETKHLIMIGDHKQLRPRVNYELSVGKKTGYDLNRSLFERLILKGFPHQTLFSQHRMRPEISALVREMTYPELEDAEDTRGRPNLRGFTDNIIFVNHKEPESEFSGTRELGDTKASSSKQNWFEADMTLKCVRYLAQQGYGTSDIVVLTPYLGQLRLLHDKLKVYDPVLNDLDYHELVRAGLMPEATAKVNKSPLKLSTIDNFQGEEANIIVVSLTRSNIDNDIGFMSEPERLNVLISRARNAMILIGNAEHFMGSRTGGELWKRFIGLLTAGMHVYDGFPVRCERHTNRKAILQKPADFDTECPDGGCTEPCNQMLNCGIHKCPDCCHQLSNHSKIKCEAVVSLKCDKGHVYSRKCHAKDPDVCHKCKIEAKKAREEDERKAKASEERIQHLIRMAEVDRKIEECKAEAERRKDAKKQADALQQKKQDLLTIKENYQKELASNQTPNTSSVHKNTAEPTTNAVSKTKSDPGPLSSAEAEWERQKQIDGASNDAIDKLMSLTGLEVVKKKMLDLKAKFELAVLQGTDISKERLGVTMLGNPGTGKTTVARIYGEFLASIKAIPGSKFVEVTGSNLANDGVKGAKDKIEKLVETGGGIFFLDEAYQLTSGNSYGGKAVLDYLLAEIEERRGTIVFIFAGYKKDMEEFFKHNEGLQSRVPNQFNFEDYSDEELLKMLGRILEKKYKGRAKLDDGPAGLYAKILIRRLGRRRGSRGFGNARDLENTWDKVADRQVSRYQQERTNGSSPDPYLFTQTDLIGPEPSEEFLSQKSKAWQQLQQMIGLESVKQSVGFFLKTICCNYHRELAEQPPLEVSLNRLFLGNPGTGKTTVAKLYGEILADLGLLSSGELVLKTPADFIGAHLGESEKNTKGILQDSCGKVLVIDEAYGLSPATGTVGNAGGKDPYKAAVIDTIVAEVQSVPGEDRCVLLLGYTNQMKEMLRNANEGLSRRFPIDSAFIFEDYDDKALRKILEYKLKKQGLEASEEAKDVAMDLLARAKERTNFGNAGEVENLLSRAKVSWQTRQTQVANQGMVILGPEDFDKKFDRIKSSECSVKELFADIVGLGDLKEKLEGYQKMVVNLKAKGNEQLIRELIPFNFIFKGPPGTGKTTVARRIAQFYYNIGILPTNEYMECSTVDFVASYVGQTARQTKETLRSALGKVLFVDEAYRLKDGPFGKEAVDEMVDSLTKPDFKGKLVVILAGYTKNMNDLLGVNPGLSRRFPHEIIFESMLPKQCIELLASFLLKHNIEVTADIHSPESSVYKQVFQQFSKLRELPFWGNGGDVGNLAEDIIRAVSQNTDQSPAPMKVGALDILQALDKMLAKQTARSLQKSTMDNALNDALAQAVQQTSSIDIPKQKTSSSSSVQKACPPPVTEACNSAETSTSADRDPGVSDAVWEQLQRDIADQKEQEKQAEAERRQLQEALEQAQREFEIAQKEMLKQQQLKEAAKAEEAHRLQQELEKARIRAEKLKEAEEAEKRRLTALREAQLRAQEREQQAQQKLRNMGVCPVGYEWIKQAGGYRCAGGSHFVTDSELGF